MIDYTNVLSIDGGGIKGLVSAVVLEKLEELIQLYSADSQARLAQYFDLIAGTSTGAILAAIYLCPDEHGNPKFSAKQATGLYIENGKTIFTKKPFYPINTCFGLFGSKYTNKYLKRSLTGYFGTTRLSELLKPSLLAAYDTEKRAAIFYNSVSARKDPARDCTLTEAVLASAAAPTYFPPIYIQPTPELHNSLTDGGVFANNPAMCALVEAFKLPTCDSIRHITLLSVGNLSNKKPYPYRQVKRWGLIGWAVPMLNIMMDASVQTVDFQLQSLFESDGKPGAYLRCELRREMRHEDIPKMDDASETNIRVLLAMGQELIQTHEQQLHTYAKKLVAGKTAAARKI